MQISTFSIYSLTEHKKLRFKNLEIIVAKNVTASYCNVQVNKKSRPNLFTFFVSEMN